MLGAFKVHSSAVLQSVPTRWPSSLSSGLLPSWLSQPTPEAHTKETPTHVLPAVPALVPQHVPYLVAYHPHLHHHHLLHHHLHHQSQHVQDLQDPPVEWDHQDLLDLSDLWEKPDHQDPQDLKDHPDLQESPLHHHHHRHHARLYAHTLASTLAHLGVVQGVDKLRTLSYGAGLNIFGRT